MTAALVLAVQGDGQDTGPIGLLIVVLLGITTVLLIRNMNGRLKRLPREFPDQERPADPDSGAAAPDREP